MSNAHETLRLITLRRALRTAQPLLDALHERRITQTQHDDALHDLLVERLGDGFVTCRHGGMAWPLSGDDGDGALHFLWSVDGDFAVYRQFADDGANGEGHEDVFSGRGPEFVNKLGSLIGPAKENQR